MEESSQKKEMLIEFLQCAAMGDMEEILTTLMGHPDLINAEHSESGDTALVVAARENQPEVNEKENKKSTENLLKRDLEASLPLLNIGC